MRKFKILFSIVFLLLFISLFSQKTFATHFNDKCDPAAEAHVVVCDDDQTKTLWCSNAWNGTSNGLWVQKAPCDNAVCTNNNCGKTSLPCVETDVSAPDGSCCATKGDQLVTCSNNYKCEPGGACPVTAPVPPDSSTQETTETGCSFKMGSTYIPVIACKNGGVCIPNPLGGGSPNLKTGNYEDGLCMKKGTGCPDCGPGYQPDNTGNCVSMEEDATSSKPPAPVTPSSTQCTPDKPVCNPGFGCTTTGGLSARAIVPSNCLNGYCDTAIGTLPTSPAALLKQVFSIVLVIAGLVALGLIIASGYKLMISQGNPEMVKGIREQLTAAIIGLLFIIFSLVILQTIGANILNIPGFG